MLMVLQSDDRNCIFNFQICNLPFKRIFLIEVNIDYIFKIAKDNGRN